MAGATRAAAFWLIPAAFAAGACASTGGGGGAAPCDDAGLCPSGLVCDKGVCVTPGGSGGGGATGGFGGSGATGGFGGSGATGGFGGGTGGGGTCDTSLQGATCTDVVDTTKPCGQCVAAKCCSTMNTCLANATCSGLFECVYSYCTTGDVNTCIGQNCPGCATSASVTAFNAISTCTKTSCATECAGSTP